VEHGTKHCEVTVYIIAGDKFVEIKPWCITAIGFRRNDTYQLVARKTLKYLCQMYEWHLGPTAMMYFPPLDRNRPTWEAIVQTLENLGALEDDPIVVAMAGYLLALDDMCNQQGLQVKSLIARAEVAESRWCKAQVELSKAEACVANAESHVIALEEELMT
jgi:hypothetical protein